MPIKDFWIDSMKTKGLGIFIVLLIVITSGCTPVPSPSLVPSLSPTLSPVSEKPSAPLSVPTTSPVSTAVPKPSPEKQDSETIEFVWTTEPGLRLEDATVPYVYRLDDGRLRIYYGGPGGILSAISDDGLTFKKEAGVRIVPGSPGSPEAIVSDPTVVALKNGKMRMYYNGATGSGGPGQSVHSIYSAISSDGLNFDKEGIRIDSQQTPDRGWASVPEAITLPDGRVRIYYVSDGLDVKHGVVSAVSEDGLSFTREETRVTGFVDPAVIRLADGGFILLAVAFPLGPGGKLTDAAPGIYSFLSEDGIKFEHRGLVLAGENNIDPVIVNIGDGAYRVYYWNITDKPPVIKSMSGKLASSLTPVSATAAPNIVSMLAPRSITGAKVWLFAVSDLPPSKLGGI